VRVVLLDLGEIRCCPADDDIVARKLRYDPNPILPAASHRDLHSQLDGSRAPIAAHVTSPTRLLEYCNTMKVVNCERRTRASEPKRPPHQAINQSDGAETAVAGYCFNDRIDASSFRKFALSIAAC